jgi:aminobenzoyl-glutamate utilization protein B
MSKTKASAIVLCLVAFHAIAADDRDAVLRSMDAQAKRYKDLSRRIWEAPELGYKETRSAALLESELRNAGFRVQDAVAQIPTAFIAEWGKGRPVIAILGEYDALPGLSQDAVPERKPLAGGGPGHGCGHNLLGTAALFAAVTVKDWMSANHIEGTIRYYGTPAEEGGDGKFYMLRAGAFKDVDAVLSWHPGDSNVATRQSTLAIIAAKFRYHGKPAHAAVAPEAGRSALDAVMVMAHAVELLREHVPETTRMHYIITNGGQAPNIVPEFAELFLYARHPSMPVLDGIWERIQKCAEAGALATETKLETELINSSYDTLPNDALSALVDRNLRRVGGVEYTPEERDFAIAIQKTMGTQTPPPDRAATIDNPREGVWSASTDVGDISWNIPTAQLTTATFAPGIPPHTWQSTACVGMSIGQKGMVVAAKTIALTAMDLFTDPAQVRTARESFEKRLGERVYKSRIPDTHPAPLNYREK